MDSAAAWMSPFLGAEQQIMNDRTNYSGHYSGPRPQGIVFRLLGKGNARFSPYMCLSYVDYEAGRDIKLDFGSYDVVMRAAGGFSLDSTFEAIAHQDCSEISEKEGMLSIEIIEKEEGGNKV